MYSLDINFLSDREERISAEPIASKAAAPQSPIMLYAGLIIGIGLPAAMVGLWLFSQYRTGILQQENQALDSQIAQIESLRGEFADVDSQVQLIEEEVQALATVFDRIKPWSAILQDVRDRIPNMPANTPPDIVQVIQIAQVEEEPAPRSSTPTANADGTVPPPPPPPETKIQIQGYATTFTAVNDFLLLLQRSPFLNSDETRLVVAELVDDPRQLQPENEDVSVEVSLRQQVSYTIEARLTDMTASELFDELEGTLSYGLTSRIETLRNRGVLQP
ncbi:MAG: PilN domain-containing protein [Synechococcales cyanobacterium K44_A2020_017]|nr:PilN domain-containing protein [Synechococcales cyanobacterium K32_A2020_035]MBF2093964.1 PilN domain-containing protein [Synechococcales cyanobacterium K44_A2020_017]